MLDNRGSLSSEKKIRKEGLIQMNRILKDNTIDFQLTIKVRTIEGS